MKLEIIIANVKHKPSQLEDTRKSKDVTKQLIYLINFLCIVLTLNHLTL
jgi:hypothetical protein